MKPEMIKTLLLGLQEEKKTGFIVTHQKPNRSPVTGKHHTLHSQRIKASQVKHQKHVGDLGHYWKFCNI
jgi:hypothetical protein